MRTTNPSSSFTNSNAEEDAFIASFQADDVPVEFLCDFDLPQRISLHSHKVGPFRAGMTTTVPLWMGLLLQDSLIVGKIVLPPFFEDVEALKEILQNEKTRDEFQEGLPYFYFEIAHKLHSLLSPSAQLLLQDIGWVRVDKLQRQFQQLMMQNSNSGATTVLPKLIPIPNICSHEMLLLRQFIQQGLQDYQKLLPSSSGK